MTLAFAWLCLAAFGAVAFAISALVGLGWPVLRHRLGALAAGAQGRLLLALAALPFLAGALALTACLLPSFSLAADHCLHHGAHHPHLCLRHMIEHPPALAIIATATALLVRMAVSSARAAAALWASRRLMRVLLQVADRRDDGLLALPKREPEAFVLGLLRPRLFASEGLLSMSPDITEVVLGHERAHVRRRDPLRQLLVTLLSAFHLPYVAPLIRKRLQAVQEMAADAEAARMLGDAPRVAAALLALGRARGLRSVGLAFAGGDIEERVRVLLADHPRPDGFRPRAIALAAAAALLGAVLFAGPLHHAIETLLGLLG